MCPSIRHYHEQVLIHTKTLVLDPKADPPPRLWPPMQINEKSFDERHKQNTKMGYPALAAPSKVGGVGHFSESIIYTDEKRDDRENSHP